MLVVGELFKALAFRSRTRVFWQVGAFSNLVLIGVLVASFAAQVVIHALPVDAAAVRDRPAPGWTALLCCGRRAASR